MGNWAAPRSKERRWAWLTALVLAGCTAGSDRVEPVPPAPVETTAPSRHVPCQDPPASALPDRNSLLVIDEPSATAGDLVPYHWDVDGPGRMSSDELVGQCWDGHDWITLWVSDGNYTEPSVYDGPGLDNGWSNRSGRFATPDSLPAGIYRMAGVVSLDGDGGIPNETLPTTDSYAIVTIVAR